MSASVRLNGLPAGMLDVAPSGDMTFTYSPERIQAARKKLSNGYPISLSMPVTAAPYGHDRTGPFFRGILPDNMQIKQVLATYLQVNVENDYAMLTELGRESPGAIGIFEPGAEVVPEELIRPSYRALNETDLADLIRKLPSRPLFVDAEGELRISLAGVTHKAAVLVSDGKVCLPTDGTPTTHILKIDIDGLPGSIQVENFCMKLAAECGLQTPKTAVMTAADIPFMLVSRYDRTIVATTGGNVIRRFHQEDFCQALGLYPMQKYERDGGPTWKDCFRLMDRMTLPAQDKTELLDRAIFQFLVGNPDAHGKNYSILFRNERVSLAKIYDLNNAAAFRHFFKDARPRLAMSVGGERNPEHLTLEHWTAFARDIGIRATLVERQLKTMASQIGERTESTRDALRGTPGWTDLIDVAVEDICARADRVMKWFDPGPANEDDPSVAPTP